MVDLKIFVRCQLTEEGERADANLVAEAGIWINVDNTAERCDIFGLELDTLYYRLFVLFFHGELLYLMFWDQITPVSDSTRTSMDTSVSPDRPVRVIVNAALLEGAYTWLSMESL